MPPPHVPTYRKGTYCYAAGRPQSETPSHSCLPTAAMRKLIDRTPCVKTSRGVRGRRGRGEGGAGHVAKRDRHSPPLRPQPVTSGPWRNPRAALQQQTNRESGSARVTFRSAIVYLRALCRSGALGDARLHSANGGA